MVLGRVAYMARLWAVGLLWLSCYGGLVLGQGSPPVAERLPALTESIGVPDGALPPPVTEKLADGPELVIVEPAKPQGPIWENSLQVGVKGARGNANTFNSRVALDGKRAAPLMVTTYTSIFSKGWAEGAETQNNWETKGRNEWLFPGSRFSLFLAGTALYDEFTAYDVRVLGTGGVGYAFIDQPFLKLKGRVGAGASHEIGGPDDSIVPELDFGGDFEWKLTDRQTLKFTADYYPSLEDFAEYRLEGKAAWEVLVDPVWNMSMQLNVTDRYDSTPQGRKANDFDYSFVLIWKL